MAVAIADDDLFTRAVSGYREAFLDRHKHLSEAERKLAWTQRLSQFITDGDAMQLSGPSKSQTDTLGKRSRPGQRTLSDAPPSTKRRATVCDYV